MQTTMNDGDLPELLRGKNSRQQRAIVEMIHEAVIGGRFKAAPVEAEALRNYLFLVSTETNVPEGLLSQVRCVVREYEQHLIAVSAAAFRLPRDSGIAIGPILFIVAILAILAAAIAAGSGSFTSSTTNEANRTKAAAMIEIGENLKVGMDRITMEGQITPTNVDINALNTSASNALFAPSGGGVAVPSVAMANNPAAGGDRWYYVTEPVNGFGSASPEVFAVLHVASGVCAEINNRAIGAYNEPTATDMGNFASASTSQIQALTNWPTVTQGVNLASVGTGCVNNSNAGSLGDYYYQILAIQ